MMKGDAWGQVSPLYGKQPLKIFFKEVSPPLPPPPPSEQKQCTDRVYA